MALITLRQLLDHAAENSYAVPAFNINNMEQGLAILKAALAVDSPVILQASRGAGKARKNLDDAIEYYVQISKLHILQKRMKVMGKYFQPKNDDEQMMKKLKNFKG